MFGRGRGGSSTGFRDENPTAPTIAGLNVPGPVTGSSVAVTAVVCEVVMVAPGTLLSSLNACT